MITLDKHNIAASASEDVTIETTNRAGETYFRYSREEMGKNRRMNSLLMWAYMTCKLSKYGSNVVLDSSHVRWAQDLLQDPTKLDSMDLRKTWDQRSDPTIPHDSDLLDPYGESDADWSDIEG